MAVTELLIAEGVTKISETTETLRMKIDAKKEKVEGYMKITSKLKS